MKFRVTRRIKLRVSRPAVSVPKKRSKPLFFADLDNIIRETYEGQFFTDLDTLEDEAKKTALRLERYKARRERNTQRSHRILKRLRRVENMDLYKMTRHITPDFFGEKYQQFTAVKELYRKKARIIWYLAGLYNYLAFDYQGQGWSKLQGFGYSRHRDAYEKLMDLFEEKLRQDKWDKKREKVRKSREKAQTKRDQKAIRAVLKAGEIISYESERVDSSNMEIINKLRERPVILTPVPITEVDDWND